MQAQKTIADFLPVFGHGLTGLRHLEAQAKIQKHRLGRIPTSQDDVVWLDVAVNDTAVVTVADRREERPDQS